MNTVCMLKTAVDAKVRHTSDPVSWYSVEVELTVQKQYGREPLNTPILLRSNLCIK